MRMEKTTPYDAAIEDLRRRYPASAPVLDAFAPLAADQAVLAGRLEAEMHEAGGPGFPVDPERLRGGAPLLADADLTDLGPWLAESARAMLPAAGARLPLAGTARCMEAALESGAIDLPGLTRALLDQNAAPLEAAARALGAPEAELTFLVRCLAAPVLAAVAKRHAAALAKAQWAQGHCPVCGSQPVLATLARREELGLEHLVGGGGGKMLHCSLCDHAWRFRRDACPACGETGHEQREVLRAEGVTRERIEVCKRCGTYLLCADLREFDTAPWPKALPLGLAHLDAVARARKLRPLAVLPWNSAEL